MTHYLVYYHDYWDDINKRPGPNGIWSTNSEKMHETVRRGDWLWAVISAGSKAPGEWRLIERICVREVDPKPSLTKWGKWHFYGEKKQSQIFSIEDQPDFTAILWLLKFASGRRIKLKGKRIGQALQSNGFRPLSEYDCILLEEYSETLKGIEKRS